MQVDDGEASKPSGVSAIGLTPPRGSARVFREDRGLELHLDVFVEGDPKPEPRPRSSARSGRSYVPNTADEWKHAVRAAVVAALQSVPRRDLDTALRECVRWAVELRFQFARPKSHRTKGGGLAASSPLAHLQAPDVDNLEKAVLDAVGAWKRLPALLWANDSAIDDLHTTKRWAYDARSGVSITVRGGRA